MCSILDTPSSRPTFIKLLISMAEKSIWYQTKIQNPYEVLYDQETRKYQGMMPNLANEMPLAGHPFFTKIDILHLKCPHVM